jgi:hypothetical protein
MSEAEVICGTREAKCECVLPVGHDGLHECDPGCNGSWGYDADGGFVVGRLPNGTGQGRPRVVEPLPFGMDPLIWAIMNGPPITAKRGGIRYVIPPSLTSLGDGLKAND